MRINVHHLEVNCYLHNIVQGKKIEMLHSIFALLGRAHGGGKKTLKFLLALLLVSCSQIYAS